MHGLPQEVRRGTAHNPDLCASFGIFADRPFRLAFSLLLTQPLSSVCGPSSDSTLADDWETYSASSSLRSTAPPSREDLLAPPAWDGPPSKIITISDHFFASLLVFLLAAPIAVLGKQWLNWQREVSRPPMGAGWSRELGRSISPSRASPVPTEFHQRFNLSDSILGVVNFRTGIDYSPLASFAWIGYSGTPNRG